MMRLLAILALYASLASAQGNMVAPMILEGSGVATYTFALDATSHSSNGNGTSLTWAHTVTASEGNRGLYVGVAYWDCAAISTSSVTYNSVAMTLVGQYCTGDTRYVAIYRLLDPATGAHNIVATLSGNPYSLVGGGWSFTGVNQSTPDRVFEDSTAYGGTGGLNVASVSGNIVIGICGATVLGDAGAEDWSETQDLSARGYHVTATTTTTSLTCDMDGSRTWTFGGVAIIGN